MTILLVDDSASQRLALAALLEDAGYTQLEMASSGALALARLAMPDQPAIDLVLMDLHMPGLNGIEACRHIKALPLCQDIPIIIVTTSEEAEDLKLAFAAGAMDYLTKPPNEVELLARVGSALKLKQETDARKARERELREVNQRLEQVLKDLARRNQDLQVEQEKSERLLLNVLPQPIAERLKHTPSVIAERFAEATVLFADIVGFTELSAQIEPVALVNLLNEVFSLFDQLAEKHNLEKIKTIGDAYMVVGGVPMPHADHIAAVADMALDVRAQIATIADGQLSVRLGLHTGPVVAGVIGKKKFIYDLWGDTVNLASRMEAQGAPNHIQVTPAIYAHLQNRYRFSERGLVQVKGKGEMQTYWLLDRAV